MADYFWKSYSSNSNKVFGKKSLKEFRDQLEVNNSDYSLIRDVCNAHKHLELDRKSKRVTNANQTNLGKMGWGAAKWGNARWGSPKEVVVTDDTGEKHHFKGLVRRTESMWERLLI